MHCDLEGAGQEGKVCSKLILNDHEILTVCLNENLDTGSQFGERLLNTSSWSQPQHLSCDADEDLATVLVVWNEAQPTLVLPLNAYASRLPFTDKPSQQGPTKRPSAVSSLNWSSTFMSWLASCSTDSPLATDPSPTQSASRPITLTIDSINLPTQYLPSKCSKHAMAAMLVGLEGDTAEQVNVVGEGFCC